MSAPDQDRAAVDALNAVAGTRLSWIGRAADGTSGGAILVELDDGRPGVVTRFLGTLEHAQQTARILAFAVDRGLPVPRHHRVVSVGADIFLVQDRLPGRSPIKITPAVIDAVVEVNDRFAHVLADHPGVPIFPLHLTRSGDPYPRWEVLADFSPRSRRILRAIIDTGLRHPTELTGDDLLHVDLDLSNVLFDSDGRVDGVVDWNLGAYRGDRHLALIKTRFEQEWALNGAAPDPVHVTAAEHLDEILAQRLTATDLRRYWASRMLHQLHWILQSGTPDVIDWHLRVAEDRLLN